jgi:hypothetical protein
MCLVTWHSACAYWVTSHKFWAFFENGLFEQPPNTTNLELALNEKHIFTILFLNYSNIQNKLRVTADIVVVRCYHILETEFSLIFLKVQSPYLINRIWSNYSHSKVCLHMYSCQFYYCYFLKFELWVVCKYRQSDPSQLFAQKLDHCRVHLITCIASTKYDTQLFAMEYISYTVYAHFQKRFHCYLPTNNF